ncbi:hypothetical protein OPV22_026851 [Ensete ventricosum]|uniref:Uncharacterized protein n=1 Tax=Ensete ventricosum TaxID=4639 RepID=A0AAV8PYT8_ENSVE|nr:hypothetical protein OPV22_026851 [Ensete ventricosum]
MERGTSPRSGWAVVENNVLFWLPLQVAADARIGGCSTPRTEPSDNDVCLSTSCGGAHPLRLRDAHPINLIEGCRQASHLHQAFAQSQAQRGGRRRFPQNWPGNCILKLVFSHQQSLMLGGVCFTLGIMAKLFFCNMNNQGSELD